MTFDILAASIAMNIILLLGLGWHWIQLRRLKYQLSEAVSDITHEVIGRAAAVLCCSLCVSRTKDDRWEAHCESATASGATPVAAVIKLLEERLKQK